MADQEKAKPPGDCSAGGLGTRANADTFTLFACQYTMTGPQFQSPVFSSEASR